MRAGLTNMLPSSQQEQGQVVLDRFAQKVQQEQPSRTRRSRCTDTDGVAVAAAGRHRACSSSQGRLPVRPSVHGSSSCSGGQRANHATPWHTCCVRGCCCTRMHGRIQTGEPCRINPSVRRSVQRLMDGDLSAVQCDRRCLLVAVPPRPTTTTPAFFLGKRKTCFFLV